MKEKNSFIKLYAIITAFFAAGIWGFLSIPLRNLTAYPSEEILFYRIVVSALVLISYQFIFNRKRIRLDLNQFKSLKTKEAKNWVGVCLLSSLFITANWYAFIFVINHINIQSGAFAYMVCPLLTATLAYFILKEPVSLLQKIALSIALLAVILLASQYLKDVLWSILVAIWYAIYLIVQKFSPPIEKGIFLALQLFFSLILIMPYFLFHRVGFPLDLKFWCLIMIISIVFTIFPLYLSLYALQYLTSTTMGIIIYFNPIVSFLVAIFYFHEKIVLFKLEAYSLVFMALIIFHFRYLFPKSKKKLNIDYDTKS